MLSRLNDLSPVQNRVQNTLHSVPKRLIIQKVSKLQAHDARRISCLIPSICDDRLQQRILVPLGLRNRRLEVRTLSGVLTYVIRLSKCT